MPARIAFTRTVAGVALLKITIGLSAVSLAVATDGADLTSRDALFVALVSVYTAAALVLLRGGRRDGRATVLGVTFLLVATTFADRLIGLWRGTDNLVLTCARAIFALHVDAFMPYFLWTFVREFPRVHEDARTRRRLALVVRATAMLGAGLFIINFASWLRTPMPLRREDWAYFLFSRYNNAGVYWISQFVCFLGALATLELRVRRAARDEARRVALLVAALVGGLGPSVVWLLAFMTSGTVADILPLSRAGWVVYPTLVATPFATAYAVLVRRALDVGVVIRAAVQYAFTRRTLQLALGLPVLMLLVTLYAARDRSMTQLVSSRSVLLYTALTFAGVVVARGRHGLLDQVDRHFFRERYDARHVLGALVDQCRQAATSVELGHVLRAEIERALHPTTVVLLLLSEYDDAYIAAEGPVRALARNSALASLLSAQRVPVDVDVGDERSRVAKLPEDDRHWLVDADVALLVPLHDLAQRLVGIIALGEKRNELPYTREDRELLIGVVAEAEMTMAYRQLAPVARTTSGIGLAPEPNALECDACHTVVADGTLVCPNCGGSLSRAPVPHVVGGKFRVQTRLGAGGMGVVYRATDLELGRFVAIKTLPFVTASESAELRREARAMALVSHPNLAQIFGLETSQGRPMLVVEYLAGGTLAERLSEGPLAIDAALDIGIALAGGLAALHDAGILHRDVKPANIAFATSGVPKLLDFGLARIAGANRRENASQDGVLVGTPQYMSPEVLRGDPPDVGLDLWALCVVLYESISGRNPLAGSKMYYRDNVLCRAPMPDLRQLVPDAHDVVAEVFVRALSDDVRDRPHTAHALGRALRIARGALAGKESTREPPFRGLRRRSRRQLVS